MKIVAVIVLAAFAPATVFAQASSAPCLNVDVQLPPSQPPPSPPPFPGPALAGPRIIKAWAEGDAIPAGYHKESRVRVGLVAAGAATLGAVYLLTSLIGAISIDTRGSYSASYSSSVPGPSTALFIPVVGPLVELGNMPSAVGAFMLIQDFLLQTAGAVMLLVGVMKPKVVLVRDALTLEPSPHGAAVRF